MPCRHPARLVVASVGEGELAAHVEREIGEAQRPGQIDAVLALDDAQIVGAREAARDLEARR